MKKTLFTLLLLLTTLGVCEEVTRYYFVNSWADNDSKNYYVTDVQIIQKSSFGYADRVGIINQFRDQLVLEYGKGHGDKSFGHEYVLVYTNENECIKDRKRTVAEKIKAGFNIIKLEKFEYVP